jgi:hypothetical protein
MPEHRDQITALLSLCIFLGGPRLLVRRPPAGAAPSWFQQALRPLAVPLLICVMAVPWREIYRVFGSDRRDAPGKAPAIRVANDCRVADDGGGNRVD